MVNVTPFVSPLPRHEMVYNFLIVRFFMFFFSVKILKAQVHGSAHAHLQKGCFSAGTCCIVYASNIMLYCCQRTNLHTPLAVTCT